MNPPRVIYAVQTFDEDRWRTVYLSTYAGDAMETYLTVERMTDNPLRLAAFAVDGLDFIAVHARDFRLVHQRP